MFFGSPENLDFSYFTIIEVNNLEQKRFERFCSS